MSKTAPASSQSQSTAELIESRAIQLFYERGYHGTSIRDISKSAGVGIATLFHHHSSKADLLYRILDRGFDELLSSMEEAVAAADTDSARLRAAVTVHVRRHASDRETSSIVLTEMRSLDHPDIGALREKRERVHDIFATVVSDGVESGEFTCARPAETALAIHSMCSGVVSWYREGAGMTLEEVAEHYAEMALLLVGAPS